MHSEPTYKKERNLLLLHLGVDTFGTNLALAVQAAAEALTMSLQDVGGSLSPAILSHTSTAPALSPN